MNRIALAIVTIISIHLSAAEVPVLTYREFMALSPSLQVAYIQGLRQIIVEQESSKNTLFAEKIEVDQKFSKSALVLLASLVPKSLGAEADPLAVPKRCWESAECYEKAKQCLRSTRPIGIDFADGFYSCRIALPPAIKDEIIGAASKKSGAALDDLLGFYAEQFFDPKLDRAAVVAQTRDEQSWRENAKIKTKQADTSLRLTKHLGLANKKPITSFSNFFAKYSQSHNWGAQGRCQPSEEVFRELDGVSAAPVSVSPTPCTAAQEAELRKVYDQVKAGDLTFESQAFKAHVESPDSNSLMSTPQSSAMSVAAGSTVAATASQDSRGVSRSFVSRPDASAQVSQAIPAAIEPAAPSAAASAGPSIAASAPPAASVPTAASGASKPAAEPELLSSCEDPKELKCEEKSTLQIPPDQKACIIAGAVSTWRREKVCNAVVEFQVSQPGPKYSCKEKGQTLCNPLLFGILSGSSDPICVGQGPHVTAQCDKLAPVENAVRFLKKAPNGIAEKWDEFVKSLKNICSSGPNSKYHCEECAVLTRRIRALNKKVTGTCEPGIDNQVNAVKKLNSTSK